MKSETLVDPVAMAGMARRISHGSTAFGRILGMSQPQDGAASYLRFATLQPRTPTAAGIEPEDARLTGATRSLFRRVMGLNVMRSAVPLAPVAVGKKRSGYWLRQPSRNRSRNRF